MISSDCVERLLWAENSVQCSQLANNNSLAKLLKKKSSYFLNVSLSETSNVNILVKMPLKKKDDYIPIKCEGWNGKFVYPEGGTNNVSKVRRYNQNITDVRNFFGINQEPVVLPTTWSGTFKKSDEVRMQPQRNRSDDQDYYEYNTEPTILPTVWDGTFQSSGEVYFKPERNFSDVRDYAEANRFKRVE